MIARLLGGQERGDTFARNYDPEVSRFSQFWELFKGKFGKMLLLNLFMLLTFAPVVALFILHALALTQQGATGPYGSGLGVGYPVIPDVTGAAEMAALNSDLLFYALLIPAGAIASVGIAGGMYALRNMLWTGGAFSFKDLGYGLRREFWHRGIATEAGRAVIEQVRRAGIPYLTATHDVRNLRSGRVMQRLGMRYQYSYEEQWQPKNRLVLFRMYQLDLDGTEGRVFRRYWERSAVHFVESSP